MDTTVSSAPTSNLLEQLSISDGMIQTELVPFISSSTFQPLPSPLPLTTVVESFLSTDSSSNQFKRAFSLTDLKNQAEPFAFCLKFKCWLLLEEYTRSSLLETTPTGEHRNLIFLLWYHRVLAWIYLRLIPLAQKELKCLDVSLSLPLATFSARFEAISGNPLLSLSLLSALRPRNPTYIDQQRLAVAVQMKDPRLVRTIGRLLESSSPIAVAMAYLSILHIQGAKRVAGDHPQISYLISLFTGSLPLLSSQTSNPNMSNALLAQLYNGMNVHTLKDQYAEYVAASNYSELALLNYTCLLELTHPEVNDVKQSLLKAWLKVSDTVDPACLRLS